MFYKSTGGYKPHRIIIRDGVSGTIYACAATWADCQPGKLYQNLNQTISLGLPLLWFRSVPHPPVLCWQKRSKVERAGTQLGPTVDIGIHIPTEFDFYLCLLRVFKAHLALVTPCSMGWQPFWCGWTQQLTISYAILMSAAQEVCPFQPRLTAALHWWLPSKVSSSGERTWQWRRAAISGGSEDRAPAAMARIITVHADTKKVMYFAAIDVWMLVKYVWLLGTWLNVTAQETGRCPAENTKHEPELLLTSVETEGSLRNLPTTTTYRCHNIFLNMPMYLRHHQSTGNSEKERCTGNLRNFKNTPG